jgi:hypothetical protein
MFSSLRDFLSLLAGAALSFIVVSVYWLGIPLLNDRATIPLPFLGDVNVSGLPVLGPLAVGHLQLRIDRAVAEATADLVTKVELDAANALLDEARRQREASAQALEEYRKRADAAQMLAAQTETKREKERIDYAIRLDQARRRCDLDDTDIEWLLRHDVRPPP